MFWFLSNTIDYDIPGPGWDSLPHPFQTDMNPSPDRYIWIPSQIFFYNEPHPVPARLWKQDPFCRPIPTHAYIVGAPAPSGCYE